MRDKGIVITTQGDLAKVLVACFSACEDCSARSLCLGHKNSQGLLSVKNSLHADPGDKVVIEVPESNYTKALIVLFGSLVFSAIGGMVVGYASALLFPFPSSQGSLLGFFLGIGAGMIWVIYYFRKNNLNDIYPNIIDITMKGDFHE